MESELQHYGILGQKWGVRRFQNKDGSLTSAGKKRYADDPDSQTVQNGNKTSGNGKKIAIGIGVGATVVAGTVLTAYLVKKYGGKNVSDLAAQAQTGRNTFEAVIQTTPIAQTPIKALPVHREPVSTNPIKVTPTPKVPLSQPKTDYEVPNNYDFETLMNQNSDLLKKMYAELL